MSDSLGLVVGKFWPPHRGHQLLRETAAAQVAELLVLVYAHPDDARHPAPARADWLRELYRGDDCALGPHAGATPLRIIALTAAADGLPPDAADDHTHREFVRQWLASHGYRPDVVFSSEAYGPGLPECLSTAHILVDAERRQAPCLVLLGAESSGKTTLAPALAEALRTGWAPKYGRLLPKHKNG